MGRWWRRVSYWIVGIHPLWRYESPLLIHPGCDAIGILQTSTATGTRYAGSSTQLRFKLRQPNRVWALVDEASRLWHEVIVNHNF